MHPYLLDTCVLLAHTLMHRLACCMFNPSGCLPARGVSFVVIPHALLLGQPTAHSPKGIKSKLSKLGMLIAIMACPNTIANLACVSPPVGLQGSKGKLSKLGKLIAVKAPKSSLKHNSKFGDEIPSKYYHVDERCVQQGRSAWQEAGLKATRRLAILGGDMVQFWWLGYIAISAERGQL